MNPPTILLADDDENDVLLMRRVLRHLSFEAHLKIVSNGTDVIRYLMGEDEFADRQNFPFPSLLILDMAMPGKSGGDVLEWLKGKSELENLFVVIFSGMAHSMGNKLFQRYGNVCILNSPLLKPANSGSMESMLTLFESWLRKQQSRELEV